ncbi:hypothetical protein Syun_026634 [Stephania yunnanensis]|uniref:Uncharacterized protein n=1 Tax=Stephania yunnanensis TaxID=152371 RepID=A0AAP0EUB5_9MAGN
MIQLKMFKGIWFSICQKHLWIWWRSRPAKDRRGRERDKRARRVTFESSSRDKVEAATVEAIRRQRRDKIRGGGDGAGTVKAALVARDGEAALVEARTVEDGGKRRRWREDGHGRWEGRRPRDGGAERESDQRDGDGGCGDGGDGDGGRGDDLDEARGEQRRGEISVARGRKRGREDEREASFALFLTLVQVALGEIVSGNHDFP